MKNLTFGLMTVLILISSVSFAQSSTSASGMPTPPASWVSFQQQENAKRQAFFQQMAADRKAFLDSNPEVKTYFEQMRAYAQARMAAWRAAHPPKNGLINPNSKL